MRRNRRRKYLRCSSCQLDRTTFFAFLLVVGVVFSGAKNFWYFDNGSGGSDWEIGSPITSGLQAHRPCSLTESRQLALSLVNRDRKLNSFSMLIEDPLLAQASQLHAKDMLSRNFYSHINPEGQPPADRFALIGGLGGVGEILL